MLEIVKDTTRGCEGSPQAHSLCLYHRRDPQPESLETLKSTSFSFSPVGSPFLLVTVHLADLRFLFFFISILGEVVAIGEDGPVLAVLGAELSPFGALTNSHPMIRADQHCSWPARGRRSLGPWRTGDRGKAL